MYRNMIAIDGPAANAADEPACEPYLFACLCCWAILSGGGPSRSLGLAWFGCPRCLLGSITLSMSPVVFTGVAGRITVGILPGLSAVGSLGERSPNR